MNTEGTLTFILVLAKRIIIGRKETTLKAFEGREAAISLEFWEIGKAPSPARSLTDDARGRIHSSRGKREKPREDEWMVGCLLWQILKSSHMSAKLKRHMA